MDLCTKRGRLGAVHHKNKMGCSCVRGAAGDGYRSVYHVSRTKRQKIESGLWLMCRVKVRGCVPQREFFLRLWGAPCRSSACLTLRGRPCTLLRGAPSAVIHIERVGLAGPKAGSDWRACIEFKRRCNAQQAGSVALLFTCPSQTLISSSRLLSLLPLAIDRGEQSILQVFPK